MVAFGCVCGLSGHGSGLGITVISSSSQVNTVLFQKRLLVACSLLDQTAIEKPSIEVFPRTPVNFSGI
jgi:hypothetical protein